MCACAGMDDGIVPSGDDARTRAHAHRRLGRWAGDEVISLVEDEARGWAEDGEKEGDEVKDLEERRRDFSVWACSEGRRGRTVGASASAPEKEQAFADSGEARGSYGCVPGK